MFTRNITPTYLALKMWTIFMCSFVGSHYENDISCSYFLLHFVTWCKDYFILKYLQLHIFCLLKYKLKQQIVNRINSEGLKCMNHKHQLCAYMLLFRMLLMYLKATLISINIFAFFLAANRCTSYCYSVLVNQCEK